MILTESPLVSICLLTYNHEKYIRQSVDSIINQKMNFSYELIISDDASTDQTQKILKENYSNIENIKLVLRKENVKGVMNSFLAFQEARGKYVYACEGDDYWIGQDGLQTLVDWLEKHDNYIGVCGRRITLSEKTGFMCKNYDPRLDHKDICLQDILNGNTIFDMCALLYKNFYHDDRYDYRMYLASDNIGDLTTMLYVLLHGNVFQINKVVGVYRADRFGGACSYNTRNTPQMIFEEHLLLISRLHILIKQRLNYSELKKWYASNYLCSCSSSYEVLKFMPYMIRKVGLMTTFQCVQKRLKDIRS